MTDISNKGLTTASHTALSPQGRLVLLITKKKVETKLVLLVYTRGEKLERGFTHKGIPENLFADDPGLGVLETPPWVVVTLRSPP